MTTVTVEHVISMGHRLPTYEGRCSSPHGHNVRVVAEFAPPEGVFLDFKELSDVLRDVLDPMDHAMVLLHSDPLVPVLRQHLFRVVTLSVEPTTENLATLVHNELSAYSWRGAPLPVALVTVHETAKYAAVAMSGDPKVARV